MDHDGQATIRALGWFDLRDPSRWEPSVYATRGGEPISAVYASTMRRAIQTVEPLARLLGLPVTALNDLRERRLSGEPVDDHGAAVAWCWANPAAALPGGESNHAARRRGVAVITELVGRHKNQVIVVGSHGNLLALILQHWFPSVDHAFWSRLTMPDIYTLTLRDEGPPQLARRMRSVATPAVERTS